MFPFNITDTRLPDWHTTTHWSLRTQDNPSRTSAGVSFRITWPTNCTSGTGVVFPIWLPRHVTIIGLIFPRGGARSNRREVYECVKTLRRLSRWISVTWLPRGCRGRHWHRRWLFRRLAEGTPSFPETRVCNLFGEERNSLHRKRSCITGAAAVIFLHIMLCMHKHSQQHPHAITYKQN